MSSQASFRVMKELKEFHDRPDTNLFVLPFSFISDSQVDYDEADVMKMNALLVGPEETPYEYGMFDFLLTFPNGTTSIAVW
jgi:ubiquitin-protein ligase